MPAITQSYIHERQHAVHNFDSFGRAVCDNILEAAKGKVGASSANEVVIDGIKATIRPYAGAANLVCLEVCLDTPFGRVCKHVGA